jgi:hypothetical protein
MRGSSKCHQHLVKAGRDSRDDCGAFANIPALALPDVLECYEEDIKMSLKKINSDGKSH